jgi:transcriptional regulator with XRE-family HTH domain
MTGEITEFGKLCKKYRVDKGINMTEAAKRIEKSQAYISSIERGKIPLTFDFIKKSMLAYELNAKEKFEFLTQALLSSPEMTIPLNEAIIVSKEKWLHVLAAILLNYKGPYPKGDMLKPVTICINELKPFEYVNTNDKESIKKVDDYLNNTSANTTS